MKKAITALAAVFMLTACNPATEPGNKEPTDNNQDNPVEKQNYRGDDVNDQNQRHHNMNNDNDDNLNRKQFHDNEYKDNQKPDHLAPNINGPNYNDQYPNGDIRQ